MMPLQIQPIDFAEACTFVKALHRHHRPPPMAKFTVGCNDGIKLVGVLIATRPVNQNLDDHLTLEVSRCCTDGTHNACSILYGAAWRVARAMGYRRMVTYTLPEEGGASLRASGWKQVGETHGRGWANRSGRSDSHPLGPKWRWEVTASATGRRFGVIMETQQEATLFDQMEGE